MKDRSAATLVRRSAVWAALVVVSLSAFAPALHTGFVSDDLYAVVENPRVTGPLDIPGIFANPSWWGPARADAPGYRPVTTLSFALNHALTGTRPASYHAVNLVLHTLVCVMVAAVGSSAGLPPAAARAGAFLFALLPIHSEAVIWTVGRAELLAALGFLIAVVGGLRYVASAGVGWLLLSALALVLGALSKENALTVVAAPTILFALRLVHTCETPERSASETHGALSPASRLVLGRVLIWQASLAAAAVAYLALRFHAGGTLGQASIDILDNPLSQLSWPRRQLAALSLLGRYLALSLWPHPLSIDYSYDALALAPHFTADLYTAIGIGTVLACFFALRRCSVRHPLWLLLLLSLAAYSIVSNSVVPIGTGMAERLFYLPSMGLCLAGGWAFARLRARAPRTAPVLLAVVLLTWLGVDAARCRDWSSPLRLFEATVKAVPRSARAHMELASAYGRAGRTAEALEHFARALQIKPDYASAAYNRGNMLARLGRLEEAVASYRAALRVKPLWGSARYNLALVERMRGDPEAALDALGAPAPTGDTAAVESLRGDLLLAAGRPEQAAESYSRALAAGADAATALVNRGVAYERAYGCSAAIEDYLQATRVPRPVHRAFANAVACLSRLGRAEEAARLLDRAQVANPRSRR